MAELIKIVHALRSAHGRNAKMAILTREKDNEQWKRFLRYVYDPRKSYNASAPANSTEFDIANIDDNMFDVFDAFDRHEITGNSAKAYIRMLSKTYGEIPRLILGRSVKAGVSKTSINTVYPDLIFTFPTMKGKDVPITRYPVLSSIKYDGCKAFVMIENCGVILRTSSGRTFRFDSLKKEFEGGVYGVYEGELIHKDGRQVDRPAITGKLNSLLAGSVTDISEYSFMIYDFISPTEWKDRKGIQSFKERNEMLAAIFAMSIQDSMYVKQVEYVVHHTEEELTRYFEKLTQHGYEGSMHRYLEDVYEWTGDKRTDRLIKKKSIHECVLICIDTTPHSNPLKGITGSLLCTGYVYDKQLDYVNVTVNVGTLDKFHIMQEKEYYLNKRIEILYNSITSTNEGYSLFLPRFKRMEGEL